MIGTELAAAISAEDRHSQGIHHASPLAGLSYEPAAGEYDLFRFVESSTDGLVSVAALGALNVRGQDLVEYRDALTQDDLYTLLTFARRVCVRALRGHADQLDAGWAAVGIIDLERVDWRDAAVAVGLLAYGTTRVGADLRTHARTASAIAAPDMNKILSQYAKSGDDGLSVGGYREIATAEGPALAQDYGKPYRPTLDLLLVADSTARVVEANGYRVTEITTGTDVAPVWLPSGDARAVERARKRVSGCVSISAAPRTESSATFPEQMLLVYVVECATPDEAVLLTQAAEQPARSDVAAIAMSDGRVFLLVVARSTIKGVASIESTEGLERLRTPLERALSDQLPGG